jgi:hypothetical protein
MRNVNVKLRAAIESGSLGRSDILRCRAVGISAPIESGIAINAADRTDSDCAQKIPFHGPAAMRPKRRFESGRMRRVGIEDANRRIPVTANTPSQ